MTKHFIKKKKKIRIRKKTLFLFQYLIHKMGGKRRIYTLSYANEKVFVGRMNDIDICGLKLEGD